MAEHSDQSWQGQSFVHASKFKQWLGSSGEQEKEIHPVNEFPGERQGQESEAVPLARPGRSSLGLRSAKMKIVIRLMMLNHG